MTADELKVQLALGAIKWRTDKERHDLHVSAPNFEVPADDITAYVKKFDKGCITYILASKRIRTMGQSDFLNAIVTTCRPLTHEHLITIITNKKLYATVMSSSRVKKLRLRYACDYRHIGSNSFVRRLKEEILKGRITLQPIKRKLK